MSTPIIPRKEGDYVWVHYGTVSVGRRLTVTEACALSCGERVTDWHDYTGVSRAKIIHYFQECYGLTHVNLARDIEGTSCLRCLYQRALDLRGWLWVRKENAAEVAVLKAKLGSRVDGFENRPTTDW